MNYGCGYNSFGQYGNSTQPPPYSGSYQHHQPNRGHWNQPMSMNVPGGHFQSPRFSSPHRQSSPRGGPFPGPGGHGYHKPQFHQQFPNYDAGHNNHQKSGFNNNHSQFGKKKNRKKKVDKRELPENNNFFCDTCDRGFCSGEKFEEHVNSHEKCSDPSCSYVAAPKLVKMHFQMQHRTGVANKIWKVQSTQEIQSWIEERKRKFPTLVNIEKKESLESEKRARGEKLETKYFGKMRGGHQGNNRHRQRQRHGKRSFDNCQSQNDDHPPAAKKTCGEDQGETTQTRVNSTTASDGDPLSAILQQPHSETERNGELPSGGVNVAGGLASIMASYTDDSDTQESPDAAPATHNKPPKTLPVKETKSNQVNMAHSSKHLTNKQRKHQKKNMISQKFNSKQLSLLERLLAKEIRHERNVLLQCVHYIVKKKFFGTRIDGKRSSVGS